MKFDLDSVNYILQTNRSVRKKLDLTRPFNEEVMVKCLEIAIQAPTATPYVGYIPLG